MRNFRLCVAVWVSIRLRGLLDVVVRLVSWEWLLKLPGWWNGGDVIAARAMLVVTSLYLLDQLFSFTTDSPSGSSSAASDRLKLYGAILAGVYAALYSRFASQWSYLAGVYNKIKETEVRGVTNGDESRNALIEWKAGFIDDAFTLHLAGKDAFAGAVLAWGEDPKVSAAYERVNPSKRLSTQLDWLRRQYGRSRSVESMIVRDETATGDARNSQSDSDDPRSTG